jgi:N6-adenosine-specific RNA methylase IME4
MPKDLIVLEKTPPPEVPEDWEYKKADKDFDLEIYEWRRLTITVLIKAYLFYLVLAVPGKRTDLVADATRLPTWDEWCEEKGIDRTTFFRHFKKLKWPVVEKPKQIKSPKLPEGKYFVLYADPPWQYDNSGFDESAAQQYPTLPIDKICALPIQKLIDEKAVLFLWVTNPFLKDGIAVCDSWGFDYKTNFVWIKNKGPSMGWFNQSRHELLFIATKGEGVHPTEKMISWFEAEVTRHSKKPEKVYEMIEAMYGGPYIELFARNDRTGWERWGNEL